MSKHTPGPWILKTIQRKGRTNWHVSGPNSAGLQSAIAVVHDFAPDHDCPTQEANARLISAAPELLEALRGVMQHIQRGEMIVCDMCSKASQEATAYALNEIAALIVKVDLP